MKVGASFFVFASTLSGVLAQGAPAAPADVIALYNALLPGPCTDVLQAGFHDTDASDTAEWAYCQQGMAGKGIFLKGNGKYANMDIDCDGSQVGSGPGTRCGASQDTQDQTAFQDTVQTYGISDLDANYIPYVVFGNQGNYTPTFDPTQYGVQPLSVMAVIVNGQIAYGIWGDTNGDDGPPLIGEASLAMGTAFFGDAVNGNEAHDPPDVLYIAFVGDDAVPGKNGADWTAATYDAFEASIKSLGDQLMSNLLASVNLNGTGTNATSSATPTTLVTSAIPAPTGAATAGTVAASTIASDADDGDSGATATAATAAASTATADDDDCVTTTASASSVTATDDDDDATTAAAAATITAAAQRRAKRDDDDGDDGDDDDATTTAAATASSGTATATATDDDDDATTTAADATTATATADATTATEDCTTATADATTATADATTATAAATTITADATTAADAATAAADAACGWPGHCAGAACTTDDDCSGALVCSAGACAADDDGDDQ